jgi:diaminohydroxyphosphoribosylaminopyrimidine deaminase/5-amino-6-(5-phosphoribosylamino)uracil reductase
MVETMLSDADYMARALELAERGRGRTSPNPMVGAVVVSREGAIVGQGYHEQAGQPHAEVHALDAAAERARGATLYCTLEPCSHVGRTGPCVERIVSAGIARVVASVQDPNPIVRGRGFEYLRTHGVQVDVGVGADPAVRLNRSFFTFIRERRPFVIMKAAVSLDRRVAAAPHVRTSITSEAALRHVHEVRAEIDAIGVGSNTLLVDDPQLTSRGADRSRPLTRVIFDRRLRTPPGARVFSTLEQGPVIIMTTGGTLRDRPDHAAALARAGARLEAVEQPDFAAALMRLAASEVTSLILEGGPTIHAAAWSVGLVDCVHLYVAPITLGKEGVPWLSTDPLAGLVDIRVQSLGSDVFTEGYVHRAY